MDPALRTVVGHQGLLWCNPLGWTGMGELHTACDLREGARVLDLACGKGALVSTFCGWTDGATGVGVDRLEPFLKLAREHAADEGVGDRVRFVQADVATWADKARGYDLVACVGARPWQDREQTLRALAERVRPGGCVIHGDGYWRQAPAQGYLDHLGCEVGEFLALEQTLAVPGLDLEWWLTTRKDQFDEYERRHLGNILANARKHPGDEDAQQLAAASRRWRDGHLRWGRDTLGFVIGMWRKPA